MCDDVIGVCAIWASAALFAVDAASVPASRFCSAWTIPINSML